MFDSINSSEIYKSLDFLGFPHYRVGSFGTLWSRMRTPYWKLMNPTPNHSNHIMFVLRYPNRTRKNMFVHRLILLAFVGPCPEGMECRHLDGNPLNNRLDNLQWGTRKENAADKKKHGNSLYGERGNRTNLREKDIFKIRELRETQKLTLKELAAMFDVHNSTISRILRGKRWGHI